MIHFCIDQVTLCSPNWRNLVVGGWSLGVNLGLDLSTCLERASLDVYADFALDARVQVPLRYCYEISKRRRAAQQDEATSVS